MISDTVIIAIIAAIVPTATVLMSWRKQTAELKLLRDEMAGVKANVDGHLSRLALTNVALTVENDRLNEGTTTVPVPQTPGAAPPLVREVDGTVSMTERRKP